MKKFLLIFLILLFTTLSANAKTMKAKAVDEISTIYPRDIVRIELTNNVILSGIWLNKGYIVYGMLTDVKSPSKGEKEASFTFTLVKYKDLDNIEHKINKEIKTVYKRKHLKFGEEFLRDTDFSFSPMPNANMNMYNNETDITGRTSQSINNLSVKPLSIAESLLPKEVQDEMKDNIDYKTGLSTEDDDILILSGDKIKFQFPD